MRAWICRSWGSPRHLELGNLPDPVCGPGMVEITVKACGVNFADQLMISGRYQIKPELPFAPGMEVAGRITAVGEGVDGFTTGQKVAAFVNYGGYADKVVAPATQVVAVAESVPSGDCAAFPLAFGSAELALERAGLGAGETIIVGGAGGAVGSASVELASRRGATVVAVVGDAAKEKIARSSGADHVVSSHSRHLHDDVLQVVPDGVDVVIDPVGGGFFEESLRVLRLGGRVVVLGFASGKIPSMRLNQLLLKHQSIIGSSFSLTCSTHPEQVSAAWPRLAAMLEAGDIRPRISHIRPFTELKSALEMLKERKVAGRIVLT